MLLLEGFSNFYKIKLLFLDQLDNWSEKHLAVGSRQSPIPLDDITAIPKQLPPLQFYNYDKLFLPVVQNSGQSVKIIFDAEDDNQPQFVAYIKGGPLDDAYILKEIHFHWDSEHTLDGRVYPLESHFIHYKKEYNSYDEAVCCDKGICVLSALYRVSKCQNPVFDEISEAVEEICDDVGTPLVCDNQISCLKLLPKYKSCFYTYEGSLTTPNYNENVIWIVLGEPGNIGRDQLKSLTNINNEACEPVKKNCRDLQTVNDREIIYTSSFISRLRKSFRNLIGLGA